MRKSSVKADKKKMMLPTGTEIKYGERITDTYILTAGIILFPYTFTFRGHNWMLFAHRP